MAESVQEPFAQPHQDSITKEDDNVVCAKATLDALSGTEPAIEPSLFDSAEAERGSQVVNSIENESISISAEEGDRSEEFDLSAFLSSIGESSESVDELLDRTTISDLEHLITIATIYHRPSGRVDAIHRAIAQDPTQSSYDRLHAIAASKSCLESMLVLAEANHIPSQHAVASMFSQRQQPAEFELWLTRAADSGHALSMMGMVSLLSQRNPAKSFHYARRAADAGLRAAQYISGRCLIVGHGVECDPKSGLDYIVKAADAGMADAQVLAGGIYIQGCPGIEADKQAAMRYFSAAAAQGNSEAMYIVGSLMLSGSNGMKADAEEGVKLLKKAAEAENPRAQLDLGKMYNGGEHLETNLEKGFGWCLRAALHGVPTAAFIVGIMHLEGMGCERNVLTGCHWVEKAVEYGHDEAQSVLQTLLADPKIREGLHDWKMTQSLLKIMAPSLRVNIAALT